MVISKKDRIKKILMWTELAKEDLRVSKLLYDNGLYCFSIYHLQQAIEKSIKSMFIFNNYDSGKTDEHL